MRFRRPRPGRTAAPDPAPLPAAHPDADAPPAAEEPLTARERDLIRASASAVAPHAADMTVYFYAILFTRHPEVRELFPPGLDAQRGRLLRALLRIVDLVDDSENLVRFCGHLGRDHRKYGTVAAHFPAVGECLLASLSRYAGPAWTADTAAAWTKAYGVVADVMISAAEEDAALRPAVWPATVVHRVARGHGIAELTVRPHTPYTYAAGQYVTVETPWWPRQWRPYSPANAPREDGTLTFHVRAVPGGAVSNALVHRCAVGDVLQLGPAAGDMVLDAAAFPDLLCVAGGTGLAPVRALVEEVARRGGRHQVDLFLGARTGAELYGVDDMLRMAQRHHWLTIRGAVSHEETPGIRGSLPEVLAEYGPWYHHDVFLSGPAPMIVSARQTLTDNGTAPERIHHDPLGTPVPSMP
ncbi:flavohemoprotein [Streptomyces sp. WAC05374]|uniref:globin domain-containing protein n=1 Tax=Streptomyces sp. WAC05374 TaxID=2487420 RepID=UPI000F870057|nr:globin domain-containing protein [Streptomyces sp. WAC05374]RST12976.1 flavohemoprotein [Streptomyces sp. WAC05374]TDF45862.1 flavohemoprotein [Streptomyces sp. WAC05374]TDF48128.1 flavohemoprotein [Streptomyces sp. WAC05374]TDF52857.1 flavohemoprotein [Streptomyces sp. WAC05374]